MKIKDIELKHIIIAFIIIIVIGFILDSIGKSEADKNREIIENLRQEGLKDRLPSRDSPGYPYF